MTGLFVNNNFKNFNQDSKANEYLPNVSFILLSYNQEDFIEDAIKGALNQEYNNLEIIISDDFSSDRTYEIITSICSQYKGKHDVIYRQNNTNLGLVAHLNHLLSLSTGAIIIFAAGDDISMPNRSSVTVNAFANHPNTYEFLCSAVKINISGEEIGKILLSNRGLLSQDIFHWLKSKEKSFGAARAIRRELIDKFKPLDTNCQTEDTTLSLRALLCGASLISPEICIKYRQLPNSLSSPKSRIKLDTQNIFNQYESDIRHAYKMNYIDDFIYISLLQQVQKRLIRRKAFDQLYSGFEILFLDFLKIILQNNFPIKSRLKFFQLFLTYYFKK